MSTETEARRETGKEWVRGKVRELARELGVQVVNLHWKSENLKEDHQILVIELDNRQEEKRFENIDLEDYLEQTYPLEYELKKLVKSLGTP